MIRAIIVLLFLALAATGCKDTAPSEPNFMDLDPYENPMGPDDPLFEPQPTRLKPAALEISPERGWLFVALAGTVDRPQNQVAVIDVAERRVVDHFPVGRAPTAMALHPKGDHLVVANRFSNYLSLIDLDSGRSTSMGIDFYAEELRFDAAGKQLYIANRWNNSVQVFDAHIKTGLLRTSTTLDLTATKSISAGFNPRKIVLSPQQNELFVAAPAGLTVTAIDIGTIAQHEYVMTGASPITIDDRDGPVAPGFADENLPAGMERTQVGAPPFDVVVTDEFIFVATLSKSTHHPPNAGPDAHPYMPPTQGSPNQGFQALQNEIAVYQRQGFEEVRRYTSANYCCPDVHDISPDDVERGHLMPDEELQIVNGALPTVMAQFNDADKEHLLVAYSGSNEVQRFEIVAHGKLVAGPVTPVGFDPRDIVIDEERREAFVANRLAESVSVIDLDTFDVVANILLDEASPEFPATDTEIGELLFFSGAEFSVDGGQTCNHCHFDRGNVGKFFMMPVTVDPRGSRMTMDTRGLFDTRPWFMEAVMEEDDFSAVLSEFSHVDNFCCEDHDRPRECAKDPPARCDQKPFSKRPPLRDLFFEEQARNLIGRDHSFGNVLDESLDFEGMTRHLGLFLVQDPGLLPNPNRPQSRAARRGELLFESPTTGCSVCHPAPSFAVSTDINPFQTPIVFGPVIEPLRDGEGKNLDLLSQSFLERFPLATQKSGDVHLKAPSLRGIWDRAPGFYHDGRARTLRQALATPGHPALSTGEKGYNVADGVFDAHGGTSHLRPDELDDLIEFLLTL